MKHILYLATFVVVITLLAFIGPSAIDSGKVTLSEHDLLDSGSKTQIYSAHAPIRINSDFDSGWTKFPSRIITDLDINGTAVGYGIYIGNCTQAFRVENCTITGARYKSHPYYRGACIELYKDQNATVSHNQFSNADNSVYLFTSIKNHIENNNCTLCNLSVSLEYSEYNTISNNNIWNNTSGIELYSSEKNIILKNNISRSTDGILFESSNWNTINYNFCTNNNRAIYLQGYMGSSFGNNIHSNNLSLNSYGVKMDWDVNSNSISNNDINANSQVGVYIENSNLNSISNNNLSENNLSICLVSCDYHGIAYNNITNSIGVGVSLYDANFNKIHHNNFIGNNGTSIQASDVLGSNFWNETSEGNYWSDHTGPDKEPDGIVDTPYNISGGTGKDNYPLADPVSDAGARIPEPSLFTALVIAIAGLCLTIRLRRRRK